MNYLYIKYMVSDRCKTVVSDILRQMGVPFISNNLGEVEMMHDISTAQRTQFGIQLADSGLELMVDKKGILVERIKNAIVEMVHYSNEAPKTNFSDYLARKLALNYTYLSNLFSEVQGITVEQFIIAHKIERIKELITYGELSISEIAWKMNYSSVAHLSNQFKKKTGFSPSHFKLLIQKERRSIEHIFPAKSRHQVTDGRFSPLI